MTNYLDIGELAVLMGTSIAAIRRTLATKPFDLPPKMYIPGSKMLRWREVEVKKWMYEHGLSPGPCC
jgi:predicted DNA-binding transcriptional regulator AlpA